MRRTSSRSGSKKVTASTKKLAAKSRAARTPAGEGRLVGVVAPSSPAPLVELALGATRLADEGFEVCFHPQVKQVEGLFAGSDSDRALAFLDYAFDPDLQVVWAARGGYGAVRILPILDEVTKKAGIPEPKTLVGFSDATVLLDYVRRKWNWRTIHGPMPATFHMERVKGKDWQAFVRTLGEAKGSFDFKTKSLFKPEGFRSVRGEVVGGNLAMVHSVFGTPYAFDLKGKILFLEEIGEVPYRLDRMVRQLLLGGALEGVRAIVLGTFTDCRDASPQVYAKAPSAKTKSKSKTKTKTPMKPLRRLLTERQVLDTVFGDLGRELDIPVFYGLPVGHGNGTACLELGVEAELGADGKFRTRAKK